MAENFPLRSGDVARLQSMVRASTGAASSARRARIVLLAAQGHPTLRVAELVGVAPQTVRLWLARYEADGISGLLDSPRLGRPVEVDPFRVLESTLATDATASPGRGSRTAREVADDLGISYTSVARVWREHGIRPQRTGGWELLSDPPFSLRDIQVVGLFASRREAAVVLRARIPRAARATARIVRAIRPPKRTESFHDVNRGLELLIQTLKSLPAHRESAPARRSFQNQLRWHASAHPLHVVTHRYGPPRRQSTTHRPSPDAGITSHSVAQTASWIKFCVGTFHIAAQGSRHEQDDEWWLNIQRALLTVNGAPKTVEYFTWWNPDR